MPHFTSEELVQYLYNELSETKTAELKTALLSNNQLRDELEVLANGKAQLTKQKLMSPSKRTLDSIMQYAEKSVSEFSEQA